MNYRSVADLNADIKRWISKLPKDLDIIVGIPRSGLLAANLLALHLNLPLTDVEGICDGRILYAGRRFSNNTPNFSERKKVLVVDDSLCSGTQMTEVRKRLIRARLTHQIHYGAVYIISHGYRYVDFWYQIVDPPRVFEWNVMHHSCLINACVDIDGVLCRDPTAEENDDGTNYRYFIEHIEPLILPSVEIGWFVTCRLEKYRELTERWLKKHGIRCSHLIMMDLPDKETRIALGIHADFKAKVYKSTNAALFIESSYSQAQEIARRAGKTVLCTETGQIVDPNYLIENYNRAKGLISKAINNPLKALFIILNFIKRRLSTLRWKILAMLKKNRLTRHS